MQTGKLGVHEAVCGLKKQCGVQRGDRGITKATSGPKKRGLQQELRALHQRRLLLIKKKLYHSECRKTRLPMGPCIPGSRTFLITLVPGKPGPSSSLGIPRPDLCLLPLQVELGESQTDWDAHVLTMTTKADDQGKPALQQRRGRSL